MATKETKIATIDSSNNYAIMRANPEEIGEILNANLGGGGADASILDRVKVPAGGSTTWTIPSLEGEVDAKELEGIIVAWKDVRAYWSTSFDSSGGGVAPDCYSDDAEIGLGAPGGVCACCPLAQFGSDSRQRGQACKLTRLLFILRQDDFIPIVLAAPPSSLKALKQYFLRLAGKGVPYFGVVTKLTLDKTQNKDGIKYSEIKPSVGQILDIETRVKMDAYSKSIAKTVNKEKAHSDDFS